MFGKRAKQLGVDNAAARRSPAVDASQGYGPGLPRVPSLSGSSRDGREAQQYDDAQGQEERLSRQRSGSSLSAQRSRFSEQDLDELLDTTATLLDDDGGGAEERAQPPPAGRGRTSAAAVAQQLPPPPVEDAAPRYAPRGGMGGDDGGAGGSGRVERRPVATGRRGWYNARARRGSDADPDEHSYRPRERQRPAVDASDADAYYRDRLRTAQQDAGAEYDERYGGSDFSDEEEEEEYEEEEEDDYSRDARLAAETRAEMAGQRRAARAHRRALGEEDNRRTADGRMLVDSDDEEGPSFAPLLDSDILKKMNFNLEQLNAYLAHRGEHEGDVALHIAAQEGHVEVAYWLLMEGADCRVSNQFGDTPLHYASRWGHAEVARLLVKGGASVKARNGMGWTPLHHAASYGHAELAELLLEADAEVAAGDVWGRTPIHFAASNGDDAMCALLLSHGAAADSVTHEGDTPLHYAAGYGHTETVVLLLQRGANVRRRKKAGNTALHFAANEGHAEVVQLLLEEGADPNAFDEEGVTPLHYAAAEDHSECAMLLLEAGADANAEDATGATALDMVPFDNEEMYQLLVDGGVDRLALRDVAEDEEEEEEEQLPELAWRGNDVGEEVLAITDGTEQLQLQLDDGEEPPVGDDALALAAAVEAEADEGRQLLLADHAAGEEDALRKQMETDLAALGFSGDEIASYLESLALDAELQGMNAHTEEPPCLVTRLAGGMELTLSGPGIKLFGKAIHSLCKVGSEVLVEAIAGDALTLRAINQSRSAYFAVRLRADCFDTFRVRDMVQTAIYAKHFLAILRTAKVDTLTLRSQGTESTRLSIELLCSKSGLVKTYDVACLADPEILCATIDKLTLPVRLTVRPKALSKLLANFHSNQNDVTLLSLPPAAPGGPPEASVKRLRLLSFQDPAKAMLPGTHVTTQLAVSTSDDLVASYTHRGNNEGEATVNLKDLKVMISFCEAVDADVTLMFDTPGAPLLCFPDFRARITGYFQGHERSMDFDAESVLATMFDSQSPGPDVQPIPGASFPQESTAPSAAAPQRVPASTARAPVPRAPIPSPHAHAHAHVPPPQRAAVAVQPARSGASGAQPALASVPREESAPAVEADDIAADLLRDWRAASAPQPASAPLAQQSHPASESAVPPSEQSPPRHAAELRGAARPFVPQWAPASTPSMEESMEDGDEWVDGTPPEKRAKIGWAR